MKRLITLALLLTAFTTISRAQGGIGNMPRADLVMLSAITRDSLADELLAKIDLLRGFAQQAKVDSAALFIAHNGGADKVGKWARAVNPNNPDEKARVVTLLDKLTKLYSGNPEIHREYFAAFKDKDNPAGMMLLYQIKYVNGRSSRMVAYHFYPINDTLMLGDIQ